MINYINKKRSEKGFTLVELMVVLLIIAILIAVAVPVFLGARNRAYQNRAKQSLTNAARATAAYFASEKALPTAAQLGTDEPSYTFSNAVVAPGFVTAKDAIAIDETGATGTLRITAGDSSSTVYKMTVSPTNGTISAITTGN